MTRARLRLVQRTVGTLALLVAVAAAVTVFLPFRVLDIQCGPAISGAKVEIGAPRGSLVQDHEAPVCHHKGDSRLVVAGIVFVLAAVLGLAGWFLPLAWWIEELVEEGPSPGRGRRPVAAGRDSGRDWSEGRDWSQ